MVIQWHEKRWFFVEEIELSWNYFLEVRKNIYMTTYFMEQKHDLSQ